MITLFFECFDILHNKNKFVSKHATVVMDILFAEKFKAKIITNTFEYKTFIFFMLYLS